MFKTAQKWWSKNISLEINRLLSACNLLVYLRITTESPDYRFLLFVKIANKHDKHLIIVLPCSLEITLSSDTTAMINFLALFSFLARPKPKVPFLGLSSLPNQTKTLATQDTINLDPRTLYRVQPSFNPHLLSCSLFYNTTLLSKQTTVTSIFCCLENATMIHCYCSVNCFAGVYTKGCLFFTITNQYG